MSQLCYTQRAEMIKLHLSTLFQQNTVRSVCNLSTCRYEGARHLRRFKSIDERCCLQGREISFSSLWTLSPPGFHTILRYLKLRLVFKISRLHSLKLNKCPRVRNLLEAVVHSSHYPTRFAGTCHRKKPSWSLRSVR
jgi:hypothetical protein